MPHYFHFKSSLPLGERNWCVELVKRKCKEEECKNEITIGGPYCHAHTKKYYGVEIFMSPGKGRGLRATRLLREGKQIPYCGEMTTEELTDWRYGSQANNQYGIGGFSNNSGSIPIEDAARVRGIGSLCNHNEDGNCFLKLKGKQGYMGGQYAVVEVNQDIPKGTELEVDYGHEYLLHQPGVENYTTEDVSTPPAMLINWLDPKPEFLRQQALQSVNDEITSKNAETRYADTLRNGGVDPSTTTRKVMTSDGPSWYRDIEKLPLNEIRKLYIPDDEDVPDEWKQAPSTWPYDHPPPPLPELFSRVDVYAEASPLKQVDVFAPVQSTALTARHDVFSKPNTLEQAWITSSGMEVLNRTRQILAKRKRESKFVDDDVTD
jgi:hypothetical protein